LLTFFVSIAQKLLQFDPAKRLTAAQALKHPFFEPFLKERDEMLAKLGGAGPSTPQKGAVPKH
jgi:serine/threonine protein kinase